ncbi:MAG: hypothetical protein ATN31_09100 [Candidatus Epulonipiscioides saccharophilum]|nr:MAG: hypothetical protein ATN31_09100 [Epulopiscium sp. AS2M-Bin001]
MTIDIIKKIISSNLNIPIDKIKPKSHFVRHLNADSLDVYQIVMNIETEYGFEFSTKEISNFKRVNDIVKMVDEKMLMGN